jgi:ATP-dependent RNA helicase DDX27
VICRRSRLAISPNSHVLADLGSQRLRALQQFRDGFAEYLMATDLASRGLDIKGIETVINYDMPGQFAQYLHRVGRTARAGKKGRYDC